MSSLGGSVDIGRVIVTRRYSLPALHTLQGEGYSLERNAEVFGACSRLHGHDYQIEVSVTGPVDPESGLIIRRDEMDRLVRKYLVDCYTGTNLSDHFRHTTGEALAAEFFRLLQPLFEPPLLLTGVRVHETLKNSFLMGDRP